MGIMDTITGLLGKKKGGAGGLNLGSLASTLVPMLAGSGALSHLGGLSGIIGKLTSGGLGAQANSWVGTGANEPVHPDQLEAALGTDTVAQVASQAGISHDQAKTGLASLLPQLINHATPGGSIPGMDQIGGLLKGFDLGKLLG